MLLRDLGLRRGCCWPSLLLHCALHPLWGFVQIYGPVLQVGANQVVAPRQTSAPQSGTSAGEVYEKEIWPGPSAQGRFPKQVTHGEPQKSCSKVTDSCQHICQCRPPPPLPPPPPPPPPPRLLSAPAPNSTSCPPEESWWSGLVTVIAVCCASLLFLTVLVIICYKAIKRKPLRKEENGTSAAEYPMTSSQSSKGVAVNSAVV